MNRKRVRWTARWLLAGWAVTMITAWTYQVITHHDGVNAGQVAGVIYLAVSFCIFCGWAGPTLAFRLERKRHNH